MAKVFTFDDRDLVIRDSDDESLDFENGFYEKLYSELFSMVAEREYRPQIDADEIHNGSLGFQIIDLATEHGVTGNRVSNKASNPERLSTQFLLRKFLGSYPEFCGLISNTTSTAEIAISNAEWILNERSTAENFIDIKRVIDRVNLTAWTRELDTSERQSGVSTLGTISETLLTVALESLVDEQNFFKVNYSQVQSYGDFVLMCLPNNLWLSVKSNFARERLLASGYSNDILAVGFFQDPTEFTSAVRVRNLQRAGFLAMYCPDVAVTAEQHNNDTSTYEQVCEAYNANDGRVPDNINGKPFIRPLSELRADISALLELEDVRKRHTVGF